jgi:hypothetical protein
MYNRLERYKQRERRKFIDFSSHCSAAGIEGEKNTS